MTYKTHFREELDNSETGYFILDTGKADKHGDIDFQQYRWSRSRYNQVKEGDLFLCRRPRKASETGKFYFFGAAKIGEITGDDPVTARLIKPYPFQEYLFSDDLSSFQWTFRQRGPTWANFFNQYGMNRINKDDFENMLRLSEGGELDEDYDAEAATQAAQDIARGNYGADDKEGMRKVRSKQQVFSNEVKTNYRNKCAICQLSTRPFLVGSHIIPWSKRRDIRLDPSNGICLCSFYDKAFDKGFITVQDDYTVTMSQYIAGDDVLVEQLVKCDGKKLLTSKSNPPKQEYLAYHRDEVFEAFRHKKNQQKM